MSAIKLIDPACRCLII